MRFLRLDGALRRSTLLGAFVSAVVLGVAALFAPAPASADTAGGAAAPTISVSGSGSVHYTPDIARLSLGVRAESQSAADAAKTVNARAQSVIDAIRKLGIADGDIATSNYTIDYQAPQDDGVTPMAGARPAPARGTYVATEEIDVQTSVVKAGPVLDASLGGGANQSYGISFDTSQRTAIYREALSRAVADARSQAEILAKAAGVSIAGVQSITAAGGMPEPVRGVAMMAAAPAAPVMGGTGTIEASVDMVFRLR